MEYKLLILASETQLAACNFSDLDAPEYVSIDGNSSLAYTGAESTELLVQYVNEYFNIDAFSDLELTVILLGFDLSSAKSHELYMAFRGAKSLSVLDANVILPMLLLKKTSVSPGSQHQIAAFGNAYEVTVDEDCNFQCSPIPQQEELPEADIDSYRLLFRFNSTGMAADQKKDELIAEMEEKLAKQSVSHEEELQKERFAHEKELQQLKLTFSLKEQHFRKVEEELKDAKKVLDIVGYRSNLEKDLTREFYYCPKDAWGHWHHNFSDGDFVAEGDVIGLLKAESFSNSATRFTVKAKRAGKVFYFYKKFRYVSSRTELLAIISDLSDTREKIIEWHKRKTGEQLLDKV